MREVLGCLSMQSGKSHPERLVVVPTKNTTYCLNIA